VGEVVVRPAELADEPALIELLDELDRSQVAWRVFEPRASYREDLLSRYRAIRADPDAVHLVADEDGRVVGMGVGVVHRPSSLSDEPSMEISSFVVRSSHRGRGVGAALAGEVARFARHRGVRHLDLRVFAENQAAVAFWERLGFRPRIVQMVAPTDGARVADPTGVDRSPPGPA
jgi:ribosomal protein S18 acetylase RimI-like enzyme